MGLRVPGRTRPLVPCGSRPPSRHFAAHLGPVGLWHSPGRGSQCPCPVLQLGLLPPSQTTAATLGKRLCVTHSSKRSVLVLVPRAGRRPGPGLHTRGLRHRGPRLLRAMPGGRGAGPSPPAASQVGLTSASSRQPVPSVTAL